jgi:hypothetical protein
MRLSCEVTQKVSPRLTLEARNAIDLRLLQLRLDLIDAVYGERYTPSAKCPGCQRNMNPLEIIQGFNADPNDFTTACPKCQYRFEPKLINRSRSAISSIVIPFYCSEQTLAQLPGKETLPIDVFKKQYPGVYHSAIVHHGGLRQAFEKVGIQYSDEELRDWKNKIQQFLGELPDTTISSCIGKPVRAIRKLRKEFGIPPCQTRKYSLEN